MNRLKTLLASLFFGALCTVNQGYAQDLINFKEQKPNDWTLYFENEKVTIEYRFVECDPEIGFDNESIIFRYTNHTEGKLALNWHMHLYYNGTCRTCTSPQEYRYELIVGPNEPATGTCSMEGNIPMKVFSKFIDATYTKGAQLTALQFSDLEITQH